MSAGGGAAAGALGPTQLLLSEEKPSRQTAPRLSSVGSRPHEQRPRAHTGLPRKDRAPSWKTTTPVHPEVGRVLFPNARFCGHRLTPPLINCCLRRLGKQVLGAGGPGREAQMCPCKRSHLSPLVTAYS